MPATYPPDFSLGNLPIREPGPQVEILSARAALTNTDLVVLKNTRFGADGRFSFQVGAEIFDIFNQRQKTIAPLGTSAGAFAIAGNTNFLNYGIGTFGGRVITLRGKFFF